MMNMNMNVIYAVKKIPYIYRERETGGNAKRDPGECTLGKAVLCPSGV